MVLYKASQPNTLHVKKVGQNRRLRFVFFFYVWLLLLLVDVGLHAAAARRRLQ